MPQLIPGVNAPPAPSQEEQDRADVARILFQHQPGLGERYASWSQQHPVLSTGAELGASALLNEIPGGAILRRLGLQGMADALEAAGKLGRPGGWGEGAQYIRDPKYKLANFRRMTGTGMHSVDVKEADTGKVVGSFDFTISPDGEAYINYATSASGKTQAMELPTPGQFMHLKDQMLEKFPEVNRVRFFRLGRPFREVTLPLMRGRTGEAGTKLERPPVQKQIHKLGEYEDLANETPEEDPFGPWQGRMSQEAEAFTPEATVRRSSQSTRRRQRELDLFNRRTESLDDMERLPHNIVPHRQGRVAWFEDSLNAPKPQPVEVPPVGASKDTLEEAWWNARNRLSYAMSHAETTKSGVEHYRDVINEELSKPDEPQYISRQYGPESMRQAISDYDEAARTVAEIEQRLRDFPGTTTTRRRRP